MGDDRSVMHIVKQAIFHSQTLSVFLIHFMQLCVMFKWILWTQKQHSCDYMYCNVTEPI